MLRIMVLIIYDFFYPLVARLNSVLSLLKEFGIGLCCIMILTMLSSMMGYRKYIMGNHNHSLLKRSQNLFIYLFIFDWSQEESDKV